MNGNPRPDDAKKKKAPEPAAPQEDAAPEAEAPAVEAAPDPEVQRLQAELDAARRRVDELARAYQALNQDREEFKARLRREREQMLDVERGNVALTVLEAVDELDRALSASASDTGPLAQGVRLIRDGLLSKVGAQGIQRFDVVGQPYDPNNAEATDMELTADPDADGHVVAEVRAGYRLKDRVIRPARVKVAKYVAPAKA